MDEFVQDFFLWKPFDRQALKRARNEWKTDFQTEFLRRTLQSQIFQQFCPSFRHVRSFIKKLVLELETLEDEEIRTEFYERIVMLEKPDTEYFKTYFTILESPISLIEDPNLITQGTTGLRTWPAATFLAGYCIRHPETFRNKVILDLGSGVGYLGITLAKSSIGVKTMILSDCHDKVIQTLKRNVRNNVTNARVRVLNWIEFEHDNVPSDIDSADIIIASDVVFDPSIIDPLVKVIETLNKETFIASAVRNEATLTKFEATLKSTKLKYSVVEQSHELDTPIRLYHINN